MMNSSLESDRDPFGCATLKEEVERLRREFAREKMAGGEAPVTGVSARRPSPTGRRGTGGGGGAVRQPSVAHNSMLRGTPGGYTTSSSVGPSYTSSASRGNVRRGGRDASASRDGYRMGTIASDAREREHAGARQERERGRDTSREGNSHCQTRPPPRGGSAPPPPRATRRSASQPAASTQPWVKRPPFVPVGSTAPLRERNARVEALGRRGNANGAGYTAPTQRVMLGRIERLEADMKEMKDWRRVVDSALRRRLQRQKQLVQQFLTLAREADAISCEQEQIRAHVAALEKLKRTNAGLRSSKKHHRHDTGAGHLHRHASARAASSADTFDCTTHDIDGDEDNDASLTTFDDDSVSTASTSLSQLLAHDRAGGAGRRGGRAVDATRDSDARTQSLRHVYSWMP